MELEWYLFIYAFTKHISIWYQACYWMLKPQTYKESSRCPQESQQKGREKMQLEPVRKRCWALSGVPDPKGMAFLEEVGWIWAWQASQSRPGSWGWEWADRNHSEQRDQRASTKEGRLCVCRAAGSSTWLVHMEGSAQGWRWRAEAGAGSGRVLGAIFGPDECEHFRLFLQNDYSGCSVENEWDMGQKEEPCKNKLIN